MSGRDEYRSTELEEIQRTIEQLKEKEERLKVVRFNIPTAEEIDSIVKMKEDVRELKSEKIRKMEKTILDVERRLIINILTPLLPTLEWKYYVYEHNGGNIRAVLPDFIRAKISPIFPRYREVRFPLIEGVDVVLSNHNIALTGSEAIKYAVEVLNIDTSVSEEQSKKEIKSQQEFILKQQQKLSETIELHTTLYGEP